MISAIVMSMNNGETLEASLKSVIRSSPADKEVLVIDAHSTDNTPAILAKYLGQVRVVYDLGRGLGRARNLAVKEAKGEFLAFVDSDVICACNHFSRIEQYFKGHPDVMALDTAGIHPRAGRNFQRMENLFWDTAEKQGFSRQYTLRGWSIAVRKSVFDVVGGFWRGGDDDIDFSLRLKEHGFKVAHLSLNSWHMPRQTLRSFLGEMALWGKNGAALYYEKRCDPTLVGEFRNRKAFKFTHNVAATSLLAYLSAPLTGIKYAVKTKCLQLYVHFVVRQYAWVYGFLKGNLNLRNAERNVKP
jgi:glycosyltransferase involved in cell wall biosynthesis